MDKNETIQEEAAEGKIPLVNINREKYIETRSASGSKSLSNGDVLALLLEGLSADSLFTICDKVFKDNDFRTRYAALNTGMVVMNLRNRLRGFMNGREKENIALTAAGDEVKKEGITVIEKHAAPFRKAADEAAIVAKKAAEKAKQEKADKAVADKAKKAKAADKESVTGGKNGKVSVV